MLTNILLIPLKNVVFVTVFLHFYSIPANVSASFEFITLADIHLNNEQQHTMNMAPSGFSKDNDMDLNSFRNLSYALKQNVGEGKLVSKPTFVLHLGDMVGHQSKSEINRTKLVQENEKLVFSSLQDIFPNTPIFTLFGNNDSFEKNYGNFTSNQMSPYETAIQSGFKNGFLSTGVICSEESEDVFPCIVSQNERNGYFSAKIQPKLLLVCINTVMLSPRHYAIATTVEEQFDYLQTTLKYAEENIISVLLAMHIPLGDNVYDGSSFLENEYQYKIIDTIMPHYNNIIGILVSHTHMEEFKILPSYDGVKHIGQYFTAGLSTSHGNSPSIKVFEMDQESDKWNIKNYVTYQIHENDNEITMAKYYDFQTSYCASIPDTKDINSCLSQIEFNQTLPYFTVNNTNYEKYSVTSPESFYIDTHILNNVPPCKVKRKLLMLCLMITFLTTFVLKNLTGVTKLQH